MCHLPQYNVVSIIKDVEICSVIVLPSVCISVYALCKYFACVYYRLTLLCGCCAQEPGPVSMETGSRRRDGCTSKTGKKPCARLSESSECSDSFSEYL